MQMLADVVQQPSAQLVFEGDIHHRAAAAAMQHLSCPSSLFPCPTQVLEDAVQQLSAQLVEKETSINVLQQLLEEDTHTQGVEAAGPGRMALFSELRQLRVQVRVCCRGGLGTRSGER